MSDPVTALTSEVKLNELQSNQQKLEQEKNSLSLLCRGVGDI